MNMQKLNMLFQKKKRLGNLFDRNSRATSRSIQKYGIKASIQSRFKNFYGIYKKMLSKDLDFNNVFDIKAFRVITKQNQIVMQR